jgi:ribonuclease HI
VAFGGGAVEELEADVVVYTDGASRGNPGEAGVGIVLCEPGGRPIEEIAEYLGRATNNVAEYQALLRALARARDLGARRVLVRSDSELMVRQMNGEYRVRHEALLPLFQRAQALARSFDGIAYVHVLRERNRRADELANVAIDSHLRGDGRSGRSRRGMPPAPTSR